MSQNSPQSAIGSRQSAILFALFFSAPVITHAPLLRLPYFWDEAGYYVPAARDLLLTRSLIPHSTVSNAHPPLVIAFLAGAWKLFGYSPAVTRTSMLLVAAFTLLGVFRLARQVANPPVAAAATLCTAFFPVFFAQSSLAHLDMTAAALILWGLFYYLEAEHPSRPGFRRDRVTRWIAVVFFALACLAKETAALVPAVLFAWELILYLAPSLGAKLKLCGCHPERGGAAVAPPSRRTATLAINSELRSSIENPAPITRSPDQRITRSCSLLLSLLPLVVWFFYHYVRTSYVFGNPEFLRYNLKDTLHPARILIAFLMRLWHLFGYMNMFLLTLAAALAMRLSPRPDPASAHRAAGGDGQPSHLRRPIAPPVQAVFAVLILAHAVALSILGGAALARYLLPVYPLLIILFVSTLRRRVPWWPAFVAVVCAGFVTALLVNPPYRFAPEDNLSYADYVRLHQDAARFLEQRYAGRRVLTAWPASDELTRPWLGYVSRPQPVLRIENFSPPEMMLAEQARAQYQLAYLFATKPDARLLLPLPGWERLQTRYFGFHRDLTPQAAASLLGARIVYQQHRAQQWAAVLHIETVENASLR